MAIQVQGQSAVVAEVGGTTFRGLHTHVKPLEYGSLGHYRTSVAITGTNVQAVNSRIFELRNGASNLIVLTRLTLRAMQTAAGTAQLNSIRAYKCTSFSAVDTTNTVTPTTSVKRTTGMAAYPGGAVVRHLTLAGAAAGMTGGTLTKDANAFAILPYNVTTAVVTNYIWGPYDCVDDINGTHPFIFANNEGFIVENDVVNATSLGITWVIDCSWAEVTAF